ncbi:uncharacterized protein LOC134538056 [Bacillus rossius redtenbacheri]|uniref:uncharacterized protein LOC134538056 n=1 Tax=Bacillus rossius redtenbacheri TaxID=93214 RepID=UPI002FDD0E01
MRLTTDRLAVAALLLLSLVALLSAGPSTRNHELLTSLGLSRRRAPPSHHRKRLANESRGSRRGDDSHLVVIKLPPHPYYFSLHKPLRMSPNAVSKVPLSFRSNGKPAKVYHWNLPALGKMAARRRATSRLAGPRGGVTHMQMTSPWSGSTANEVHAKEKYSKPPVEPKSGRKDEDPVSYYGPRKKLTFQKYFPGNGKPHSFYVIEKSKKKVHRHRLLP